MRIFITGHQGFIGSHLIERLQEHNLTLLQSDLRDHQAVQEELVAADPEVIVHLAARTEVEQSFYEQITFSEVNYVGTVNLIEGTRRLKNLKNFVFASTMEVYGWQPISDVIKEGKENSIVAFDEETQPNPNAPYAVAKYACEKYLEYANRSYGLPFTAIRQTNAYGRKDNDFFVTEQIITQMLTNPNEINLEDDEELVLITDDNSEKVVEPVASHASSIEFDINPKGSAPISGKSGNQKNQNNEKRVDKI